MDALRVSPVRGTSELMTPVVVSIYLSILAVLLVATLTLHLMRWIQGRAPY